MVVQMTGCVTCGRVADSARFRAGALGLFFRPRGLRFPTPRLCVALRLPGVALAVAFFIGLQFQPAEMFQQGVAHQGGPVSLSALRGLVGGV